MLFHKHSTTIGFKHIAHLLDRPKSCWLYLAELALINTCDLLIMKMNGLWKVAVSEFCRHPNNTARSSIIARFPSLVGVDMPFVALLFSDYFHAI